MKVSGLIVAKNEWPLLAVTISHALTHHCEELWLVDNASTDGTRAGIEYLNTQIFPGRIHYFYYSDRYDQAAITSYAMRLVMASGVDFVLVLDGDEFLVTRWHQNFPAFLASRDADAGLASSYGVQVIVQNFAVRADFNLFELEHYLGLQALTIPNQENVYNSVEDLARKINLDQINFFDNHPWNFKTIPRAHDALFINVGAHQLIPSLQVYLTGPDEIVLAHLPLSSRKKMKSLSTFTEGGVQLLVARAHQDSNAIESWWQKVTIPVDGQESKFRYQVENWLADSLRPVIEILKSHWPVISINDEPTGLEVHPDEASFRAGVHATRSAINYILSHP